MYRVTKYPHGTFSWVDNTSTDQEAAKAFYLDLFGWDKQEFPIGENMTHHLPASGTERRRLERHEVRAVAEEYTVAMELLRNS